MSVCDFTYRHYVEIMKRAVDEGYRILTLKAYVEEMPEDRRLILLRHDIDLSVQKAGKMARIEHDLGIKSTYFVRLHALYNICNRKNYRTLMEMVDYGHEIGLHFEPELFVTEGENLEEVIMSEKEILEELLGIKIYGFSIHSSGRIKEIYRIDYEKLFTEKLKKAFKYYAYSSTITRGFKYISDSNRYWRDGCICTHVGETDRIYALIHPFWWAEERLPVVTLIEEAMRGEVL